MRRQYILGFLTERGDLGWKLFGLSASSLGLMDGMAASFRAVGGVDDDDMFKSLSSVLSK